MPYRVCVIMCTQNYYHHFRVFLELCPSDCVRMCVVHWMHRQMGTKAHSAKVFCFIHKMWPLTQMFQRSLLTITAQSRKKANMFEVRKESALQYVWQLTLILSWNGFLFCLQTLHIQTNNSVAVVATMARHGLKCGKMCEFELELELDR